MTAAARDYRIRWEAAAAALAEAVVLVRRALHESGPSLLHDLRAFLSTHRRRSIVTHEQAAKDVVRGFPLGSKVAAPTMQRLITIALATAHARGRAEGLEEMHRDAISHARRLADACMGCDESEAAARLCEYADVRESPEHYGIDPALRALIKGGQDAQQA